MRIFLAGTTGVIGVRLLPLMIGEGHEVAAMTRTPEKVEAIQAAGATTVLCDVFDPVSLNTAVTEFRPDLVMHQLTDLPDDIGRIAEFGLANNRIRSVGTRNLLAAAQSAGVSAFIAQGIAWPGGAVVEAHEKAVIAAGGIVLRYGKFYGSGTYYQTDLPAASRIHIDTAAQRTMDYLVGPAGIFSITDERNNVGGGSRPMSQPIKSQ